MLQLLTLALMILSKVGSHTYGGYAPSTNAHGHDLHAPTYLHQDDVPIHRMVAPEPMYASSHSHSRSKIYPTTRNILNHGHDLAYGHDNILPYGLAYGHAPANTLSYGRDHLGSAKAGWVRVAGHTQPSSADKRQVRTVVRFHVLDEKVFLPILLANVRDSRKAPGCLFADLFKNADEKASDNYALYQIFRTWEEGERYRRTPLVQEILALQRAGKTGLDQSKGINGAEQTDYITLAADADEPKKNNV